jgi:hypothetical protein
MLVVLSVLGDVFPWAASTIPGSRRTVIQTTTVISRTTEVVFRTFCMEKPFSSSLEISQ